MSSSQHVQCLTGHNEPMGLCSGTLGSRYDLVFHRSLCLLHGEHIIRRVVMETERRDVLNQTGKRKNWWWWWRWRDLRDVSLKSVEASGEASSKDCVLWPKTFASSRAFYQHRT